ncbi:MAG: hypothetical protein JWN76_1774 [Chitinophagaceae bacterium]|nr:hypothetical protein [Chitinophagaceae bacterium]
MKALPLYRILSVIINIFCVIIGFSLLTSFVMIFSNPPLAISFFILLGVVLYAWFAHKFLHTVIIKQQPFTKKQKDWLQVNAIVAFIFSIMAIINAIYLLSNPHLLDEVLKQLPVAAPANLMRNISIGLLVFALLLFIHITWTYLLLRQYKDYIEPQE